MLNIEDEFSRSLSRAITDRNRKCLYEEGYAMAVREPKGGFLPLVTEIPGTGIELTPVFVFSVIIVFVLLIRLKDLVYYLRHDRGDD